MRVNVFMYQIKERFDATKVRKKIDICKIFANKNTIYADFYINGNMFLEAFSKYHKRASGLTTDRTRRKCDQSKL